MIVPHSGWSSGYYFVSCLLPESSNWPHIVPRGREDCIAQQLLISDSSHRWGLTALDWHYESQCIPTPLAWYAHQLPDWFQRLSVVGTYYIEILVPFFFFCPLRSLRIFAFLNQVSSLSPFLSLFLPHSLPSAKGEMNATFILLGFLSNLYYINWKLQFLQFTDHRSLHLVTGWRCTWLHPFLAEEKRWVCKNNCTKILRIIFNNFSSNGLESKISEVVFWKGEFFRSRVPPPCHLHFNCGHVSGRDRILFWCSCFW